MRHHVSLSRNYFLYIRLSDMNVDNYHFIFIYNFGDEDLVARPFIFGGLGATSYVPSDIERTSIDGETRFSST